MKSVLFQKAVCFIHANAGGFADMTFHLLRSAHFLKADSTGWAGYEFPDELEAVAASGLYADKSQTDRLVVDLSLCFRRFDQIPVWHGILSWIYLVTPYTAATFNGLQFFVARPLGDEIDAEISDPSSPSPSPTSRTFEIISVQLGIVQTRRETGRAKPPNGTHDFEGRNRFDTQVFEMTLRSGDCLAWRCVHRCDLTFHELDATQAALPAINRGTWIGPGRDVEPGSKVTLTAWQPRRYAIGVQAEVQGFNFYK